MKNPFRSIKITSFKKTVVTNGKTKKSESRPMTEAEQQEVDEMMDDMNKFMDRMSKRLDKL